ncbi:MAG: cyclophilin-like fold protein [Thioalkalispiraceae bacterium]|jgi:hypothetical protein
MEISIISGDISIRAQTRDTATARAILATLPIQSCAQTWGDEVYFAIAATAELENNAKQVVEAGEIAFWTQGNSIAIGFGPTPMSHGDEIRLAAPTNIWADAIDDVTLLSEVKTGDEIHVKINQTAT